jgi:hypothetical protein
MLTFDRIAEGYDYLGSNGQFGKVVVTIWRVARGGIAVGPR